MQKVSFELNSEFVELNQLLKLVGLCDSGGAGKVMTVIGFSVFSRMSVHEIGRAHV